MCIPRPRLSRDQRRENFGMDASENISNFEIKKSKEISNFENL